jgi:hypothetical protein
MMATATFIFFGVVLTLIGIPLLMTQAEIRREKRLHCRFITQKRGTKHNDDNKNNNSCNNKEREEAVVPLISMPRINTNQQSSSIIDVITPSLEIKGNAVVDNIKSSYYHHLWPIFVS